MLSTHYIAELLLLLHSLTKLSLLPHQEVSGTLLNFLEASTVLWKLTSWHCSVLLTDEPVWWVWFPNKNRFIQKYVVNTMSRNILFYFKDIYRFILPKLRCYHIPVQCGYLEIMTLSTWSRGRRSTEKCTEKDLTLAL